MFMWTALLDQEASAAGDTRHTATNKAVTAAATAGERVKEASSLNEHLRGGDRVKQQLQMTSTVDTAKGNTTDMSVVKDDMHAAVKLSTTDPSLTPAGTTRAGGGVTPPLSPATDMYSTALSSPEAETEAAVQQSDMEVEDQE